MEPRQLQDLFVGTVAMGIGVFALMAAFSNREWFFQLRKAQWIDSRWGRTAARRCYAGLGLAMLLLGVLLAGGSFSRGTPSFFRHVPQWLGVSEESP